MHTSIWARFELELCLGHLNHVFADLVDVDLSMWNQGLNALQKTARSQARYEDLFYLRGVLEHQQGRHIDLNVFLFDVREILEPFANEVLADTWGNVGEASFSVVSVVNPNGPQVVDLFQRYFVSLRSGESANEERDDQIHETSHFSQKMISVYDNKRNVYLSFFISSKRNNSLSFGKKSISLSMKVCQS